MNKPGKASEAFLAAHPDVETLELLMPDMCGILRGKRLPRDGFAKLFAGEVRMPGSIYLGDVTGRSVATIHRGYADGDPDHFCHAVPGTLKVVPWAEQPTAQVLGSMLDDDGTPLFTDPRVVLANALKPLAEMGLTPVAAIELEFYLLDDAFGPDGRPRPAKTPAGFRQTTTQVLGMDELDDFSSFLGQVEAACKAQGIPAEAASSEYAPGQYEINLHYTADVIAACDQAVMLKRVIKAVARQHAMTATFMAKPFGDIAGSGLHVHVSLVDKDGGNVFAGPPDAKVGAPVGDLLRHAIGGLAQCLPESMAIFAPNANSYRRFKPGGYAPVSASWGVNNRSVALRVPPSDAQAARVEHRVAGADANPYLVCAAILAGIHHGLETKAEPPPPSVGEQDPDGLPALPLNWYGALDRFASAEILPRYLGKKYCELYEACRRFECDEYHGAVQPLDYEWYMRTV